MGWRQSGRASQHGVREQEQTVRFVGARVVHHQGLHLITTGFRPVERQERLGRKVSRAS